MPFVFAIHASSFMKSFPSLPAADLEFR